MSGAKDRRPALDQLVADAKRRRFDVLLAWRLDRVGRNLRHLVLLLEDLQAIGVGFVSLNEGINLSTPAGRLQLQILAALSEFERSRIQERVRAGLARARAQGTRLGPAPLIGSSLAIRLVRDRIERVAATDFTALIEGGSGPQPHPSFVDVFGAAPVGGGMGTVAGAGEDGTAVTCKSAVTM
jgi:DNA invertase Pin-like site-specific DNA recombinase